MISDLKTILEFLDLHSFDKTMSTFYPLYKYIKMFTGNNLGNTKAEQYMMQSTESRFFVCSLCNYSNTKTAVRRHIMFKHTCERPFSCYICGKCFTLQQHLKRHYRTHTGEKPYRCHYCSKAFSQNCSLKVHVYKFHGNLK
ncbi:Zinc finger protein [Armadillidium vulgare]|nr:Zinc finger protein [Armadillidium vulgare]